MNEWIKIETRKPTYSEILENDGKFLVTDGNKTFILDFDVDTMMFSELFYFSGCKFKSVPNRSIIAWQPFPKPYKESGE